MRIFAITLALSSALSMFSTPVRAEDLEETIQLRPVPFLHASGVLSFLNKALVGFETGNLKQLRAGKVIKFMAAGSFTTKNRGFDFKKGDMLEVSMTKDGKFIIDDNDKSTKGIILVKGTSKMGVVIIERGSGLKQFGRAIMGENDRIVISPMMKMGALKRNKGLER